MAIKLQFYFVIKSLLLNIGLLQNIFNDFQNNFIYKDATPTVIVLFSNYNTNNWMKKGISPSHTESAQSRIKRKEQCKKLFFNMERLLQICSFYKLLEDLSVEITCLCRLLIYTDNDFHLILGFR